LGSFWDILGLIAGYGRLHREHDVIVPEHD